VLGKRVFFRKLMKGDPVVKSCANVFTVPHQTTEVIGELGCQVMAIIFGGKCTDSLAALRCKIMSKKVLHSSSFVTPERLPPTESATKFHCRRTYYQIMVWMGMEDGMDPTCWRWSLKDNKFVPLTSQTVF
jgi:hypothetical protein